MKKFSLFAAIFGLCAAMWADPRPTQDDFNACFEKNVPSVVNVGGNDGFALTPNLVAVAKNDKPSPRNFIKFDPFLGLYLVSSDVRLEPFMINDDNNTKKSDWVSVTRELNATAYGHVKSMGERLGELDTLTFDINGTGALLSPCCKLRGIAVGGDKFVPSRYLRHFIAYPDVYYGDVGAIFEMRDGKFFVKGVEQLGRGRALMAGDEILSINGEKFGSLREFNERILFAKKDEILQFEIMRGEDRHKFNIPVWGEMKPVSSVSEPAKEPQKSEPAPRTEPEPAKKTINLTNTGRDVFKLYGIVFDDRLNVKKVQSGSRAAAFGIKPGDKLLQVGQNEVKTYNEALNLTAKESGEHLLLFRRNGFDFFYKVR